VTVTTIAQDRSHTTALLAVPGEVDHDALYGALLRLVRVTSTVLTDVERNASDIHRHLEALQAANQAARDLLWPPPPPETVEGAVALFPHAVAAGDDLWVGGGWVRVHENRPQPGRDEAVLILTEDGRERLVFKAHELLVVRRATARDES
jgi:hypothetical protein